MSTSYDSLESNTCTSDRPHFSPGWVLTLGLLVGVIFWGLYTLGQGYYEENKALSHAVNSSPETAQMLYALDNLQKIETHPSERGEYLVTFNNGIEIRTVVFTDQQVAKDTPHFKISMIKEGKEMSAKVSILGYTNKPEVENFAAIQKVIKSVFADSEALNII